MNKRDFEKFLEDNKRHVGLADWTITLKYEKVAMSLDAEVDANAYEKTMTISVYNGFFEASDSKKLNILFHELTHARFALYQHMVEKTTEELEEQFINDLVRGFETVTKQFGQVK